MHLLFLKGFKHNEATRDGLASKSDEEKQSSKIEAPVKATSQIDSSNDWTNFLLTKIYLKISFSFRRRIQYPPADHLLGQVQHQHFGICICPERWSLFTCNSGLLNQHEQRQHWRLCRRRHSQSAHQPGQKHFKTRANHELIAELPAVQLFQQRPRRFAAVRSAALVHPETGLNREMPRTVHPNGWNQNRLSKSRPKLLDGDQHAAQPCVHGYAALVSKHAGGAQQERSHAIGVCQRNAQFCASGGHFVEQSDDAASRFIAAGFATA